MLKKLTEYASQSTHTTKRKLNKKSKEIIAQFENLDIVEKTQLLSIFLLKDELKDTLKLLGIDTSVKKRKTSKLQKDIVESVKEGLHSIGKKSRSVDKSIARRVILTFVINKKLWKKRQISSLSSHIG